MGKKSWWAFTAVGFLPAVTALWGLPGFADNFCPVISASGSWCSAQSVRAFVASNILAIVPIFSAWIAWGIMKGEEAARKEWSETHVPPLVVAHLRQIEAMSADIDKRIHDAVLQARASFQPGPIYEHAQTLVSNLDASWRDDIIMKRLDPLVARLVNLEAEVQALRSRPN